MRKSTLLAASLVPLLALAGVAAFAIPATAESHAGSNACAVAANPGPLNLDVIPVQPVNGKQAVMGVGDDDDGCGLESHGRGDDDEHQFGGDDD